MKSIYKALAEIEENGQITALATIVRSHGSTPRHGTSKMLIYANGDYLGTVGGGELERRVHTAALESMQNGEAQYLSYTMNDPKKGDAGICGGTVEVFVEPILPNPTLLLIGAGHVGKAVAYLAKWLSFRVVIVEDNPEFCTPEHIPGGDVYLPIKMDEIIDNIQINAQTYIVMATRGANIDAIALPDLLEASPAYIGVIGSKRRWLEASKLTQERGVDAEKLASVHSPIGLEIEAETPEEIAISILAEILMIRHGGTGAPMGISKKK